MVAVEAPVTKTAPDTSGTIPVNKFWAAVKEARDFEDLLNKLRREAEENETRHADKVRNQS